MLFNMDGYVYYEAGFTVVASLAEISKPSLKNRNSQTVNAWLALYFSTAPDPVTQYCSRRKNLTE